MFQKILPYLQLLLFALALPVAGAIVNWVLEFPTGEEWETYKKDHPTRARWIKIFRRLFPHLRRIPILSPLVSAVDEAKKIEDEEKAEEAKAEAAKKDSKSEEKTP